MKYRNLIFIPISILFLPVIVYLSYSLITGVFVFPIIYVDNSSPGSPSPALIQRIDISGLELNTICKEAVKRNYPVIYFFSGSELKNLTATLDFTEILTQTDLKDDPDGIARYLSDDGRYLRPSAIIPISLTNHFESDATITCYYNLKKHKVDKLGVRVSSTLVGP